MISTLEAIYVAKKQEDGTWSVVESKTGQIADIADVFSQGLTPPWPAGLVQDLNDTEAQRAAPVLRSQP